MKTIGETLKEARLKKRHSLAKVEKETKIKKEFVEAIEMENWEELPALPVVTGFVKNIASFLELNPASMAALLRRDYPPQELSINPKPDVSKQFIWSPRLTFLAGIIVVLMIIFGYLIFQYHEFVSLPNLEVIQPKENQIITQREIEVSGKTDPDTVVKVNNQSVLLDEEGNFETKIGIFEGTNEIIIKAISRSGKESEIRRKIVPELK
jgi:cytoskeletal protein RodZ